MSVKQKKKVQFLSKVSKCSCVICGKIDTVAETTADRYSNGGEHLLQNPRELQVKFTRLLTTIFFWVKYLSSPVSTSPSSPVNFIFILLSVNI